MSEASSRMRMLGLPVFETVEELADLIRLDPSRLRILTLRPEQFYRTYNVPKRRGGSRTINSPSKELKAVQAWILRNILDKLSTSPYATAYTKGRRLLDNVGPHASNRYFLSVDVRDFFPSVRAANVRRLFEALGYSKNAAQNLMRLCSNGGGLPQGGVTSPALSNLLCLRLDRRLAGLASGGNVVFTRYADDITFSTNNRNALPRLLTLTYQILRDEGFVPNEEKTRLLGPRTNCHITGMVKNSSIPAFGIGKRKKLKMRAIMHNLVAKKRPHPDYPNIASIEGWVQFLKNVDVASYNQMVRYWVALKNKYTGATNI